jgi:phage recombination protein Bet
MTPPSTALTAGPTEQRSVIEALAARYGMRADALEATLRATIFPSGRQASREQFAAFCVVAQRYGLDPFTKEIYAFPTKGGGIQPIVSVDAWFKVISGHEQCDGIETAIHYLDAENPTKKTISHVTCILHRKDWSKPVIVDEYFDECYRNSDPWNGLPRRMLRHRAIQQAGRVAFGLGGLMDEDEALGSTFVETETIDSKPLTGPPVASLEGAREKLRELTQDHKETVRVQQQGGEQDDAHDPDIPWTEGASFGGYPYDVALERAWDAWKDEEIITRYKLLKGCVWNEIDPGSAEHAELERVVTKATQEGRTFDASDFERRCAIVARMRTKDTEREEAT